MEHQIRLSLNKINYWFFFSIIYDTLDYKPWQNVEIKYILYSSSIYPWTEKSSLKFLLKGIQRRYKANLSKFVVGLLFLLFPVFIFLPNFFSVKNYLN